MLLAASRGELPGWTVAGPRRREHLRRVAELLGDWAVGLALSEEDRTRWRAAGYLHDVLRDERPEHLRRQVPPEMRDLPGPLLHGPAAAERLREEGVTDDEILAAVAYHTIGDPDLGVLGRALHAADFLEPGRDFLEAWRAELRGRMPSDLDDVVLEIVRARIGHRLDEGAVVLPRTLDFWNTLVTR